VVDSGIDVFLVKTIFLEGLTCRIPVFLGKGETSQKSLLTVHPVIILGK
jgi:hypothetical protein